MLRWFADVIEVDGISMSAPIETATVFSSASRTVHMDIPWKVRNGCDVIVGLFGFLWLQVHGVGGRLLEAGPRFWRSGRR